MLQARPRQDTAETEALMEMFKKSWPIIVLTLVVLLLTILHGSHEECLVSMNGGLPYPEPLVLLPGGSRDVLGFKQPSPGRTLVFSEGEVVLLVCTGPGNFFQHLGPDRRDIAATCTGGLFLYDDGDVQPLDFFNCSQVSESTTRRTPALCGDRHQHRLIEVGFDVSPDEFYWTMNICFNEDLLDSVWSKFYLTSSIRNGEIGLMRPRFSPENHYSGVDPDRLYTRWVQRETMARIIGREGAEIFIPRRPADSRLYMSRGHLTASGDFVYNVLKLSTYHFINVAPQWYTFNDGSWRELENSVRYYAHSRQLDLVVFTGTHGVTTLPDPSGAEKELFLDYETQRIAVPAVFWKVVYDSISRRGIAFVGVNNPHKQFIAVDNDDRYQLCTKKIDVPYWELCRAYQPQFQEVGFGYCCELDDLRLSVTSLPPFIVTGVLE